VDSFSLGKIVNDWSGDSICNVLETLRPMISPGLEAVTTSTGTASAKKDRRGMVLLSCFCFVLYGDTVRWLVLVDGCSMFDVRTGWLQGTSTMRVLIDGMEEIGDEYLFEDEDEVKPGSFSTVIVKTNFQLEHITSSYSYLPIPRYSM
jgi:hypothetical protein